MKPGALVRQIETAVAGSLPVLVHGYGPSCEECAKAVQLHAALEEIKRLKRRKAKR